MSLLPLQLNNVRPEYSSRHRILPAIAVAGIGQCRLIHQAHKPTSSYIAQDGNHRTNIHILTGYGALKYTQSQIRAQAISAQQSLEKEQSRKKVLADAYGERGSLEELEAAMAAYQASFD